MIDMNVNLQWQLKISMLWLVLLCPNTLKFGERKETRFHKGSLFGLAKLNRMDAWFYQQQNTTISRVETICILPLGKIKTYRDKASPLYTKKVGAIWKYCLIWEQQQMGIYPTTYTT